MSSLIIRVLPPKIKVNDTYQFNDYSKYVAPLFDETKKKIVKEMQFPKDCQNAFDMGVRFVDLYMRKI